MKMLIRLLLVTLLFMSTLPTVWSVFETNIVYADQISTEKTLKDDILKQMGNYNKNFTFSYEGDFAKLKTVLKKTMDEIRKEHQYIYENTSKWEMKMKYTGNKGTITFNMTYLTDQKKELYVNAEVDKILPEIIKKGATEFEKVKAVHDYIVLNGSYSSNTKNSQYTTYTFLTEQKGVCQAYALLMYKMLEELNVEAKYVKGYSNNERHAWILAKVSGEWYHVDPTWDDPIGNKNDEVRYKYFMLTDKQMAKTHFWEQDEYPAAKSEKYKGFQVANQAFTIKNQFYFISEKDKKMYQMDLATLKVIAIAKIQFQQHKERFLMMI
ncbi:transglutaminase domain-containing protein [Solibacillus cecembensis]|uniref:transglutaminase domain-containing protein n=1 Tax=Solibacillus cecembensis TaxID=459347 RepID=UPI003D03F480